MSEGRRSGVGRRDGLHPVVVGGRPASAVERRSRQQPDAGRGRVSRSNALTNLPTVLTREEVRRLLGPMSGTVQLVGLLLPGSGLRLPECLTLRVKDVDRATGEIRVRRGKGGKDRATMLPASAKAKPGAHWAHVRALHARDLWRGGGAVVLPSVLERKAPTWATDLAWR
jgi:integrase